ncbi:MAG: trypsin-like peptidase domain-containing protein [Candidatus Izemoplasmatales bacterium]
MKKIIVILALAVLSVLGGFAVRSISGETTTAATTFTAVTTTSSGASRTYVYSDLDDLIDQIYQDVYDEIYQEVYDSVAAGIGEELYEEIYAKVVADLETMLESGSIAVVANELQDRIDEVVLVADASVLGVSTYAGVNGLALGSGVVYRYDAVADAYYLITNEHVVEGGDNYRIVFSDGSYVTGELLGANADVDIAVLRFSGADLPYAIVPAALGDSDTVATGMIVLASGHPKGYDFYGSMTMGVVAGTGRDVAGDGAVLYIQHDASINSGNSGGPLFNLAGEVVGINVSKYATTDIEGMGFSIPINDVKTVVAIFDTGF